MLRIYQTPLFRKSYIKPDGTAAIYTYRTCGGLNSVTATFQSEQLPILKIGNNATSEIYISVSGNYVPNFEEVVNEIGADNFNVYLFDPVYDNGYNYSGLYHIVNFVYSGGNTSFYLRNIGNSAASWFGDKYFTADDHAQIVFKYQNNIRYDVYDSTLVGETRVGKLLQSISQPQEADGLSVINLSEVVRSELNDKGCKSIYVVATERDYFGNTTTITSDIVNMVNGYIVSQNYMNNILFNPFDLGSVLANTRDKIYYNEGKTYPFWINFILQDEGFTSSKVNTILKIEYFEENGASVMRGQYVIDTVEGLNSLNICDIPEVCNDIIKNKPWKIGVSLSYEIVSEGEFTDQFTDEFYISNVVTPPTSRVYMLRCEAYTMFNRRDFYFRFNNSMGGFTTMLCKKYKLSTEDEIISLRNKSQISNVVPRQTENVILSWEYMNLDAFHQLLGYNIDRIFKDNGVFESKTVVHLSDTGQEKTYIIKGEPYQISNGDLYPSVSIELFRPLNAGFEKQGNADISLSIYDDRNLINLGTSENSGYHLEVQPNDNNWHAVEIAAINSSNVQSVYTIAIKNMKKLGTVAFDMFTIRILAVDKVTGSEISLGWHNFPVQDNLVIDLRILYVDPARYEKAYFNLYSGIAGETAHKGIECEQVMMIQGYKPSLIYWKPNPAQSTYRGLSTILVTLMQKITTPETYSNKMGVTYANDAMIDTYESTSENEEQQFTVFVKADTSVGYLQGFVNTNFGKLTSSKTRYQYEIEN